MGENDKEYLEWECHTLRKREENLQWSHNKTISVFPVPFLWTPFGSFSLSSSHLSSDTLCGKPKPQTTTLRNSKWILSARPTPPFPTPAPGTRAGLRPRPRPGVSGRSGSVQPTEQGGYNFSFYLVPVEARGREKDQ